MLSFALSRTKVIMQWCNLGCCSLMTNERVISVFATSSREMTSAQLREMHVVLEWMIYGKR